jgi:hypothetical protein
MDLSGIIFLFIVILFALFLGHAHVKPTYKISLYVFIKKYMICVLYGTKFIL